MKIFTIINTDGTKTNGTLQWSEDESGKSCVIFVPIYPKPKKKGK